MATAMASEITSTGRAWYAITLKAEENEAEIRIYEDIGFFGVSAKQFADDLEQLNVQTIHLRLNTYGGEIFDGIAIYNSLRAHPAKIVVHVDGIAASAGSVIAMSGDEIRMADNAFLMIHEARGGVMGEADEMRKYADVLDKLNDTIASTYQGRAKKTRRYWRQKMAEETWYTAEEAKAEGLTDQIEEREKAATNRFDFKIYNQIQHVPEAVQRQWGKPAAWIRTSTPSGETAKALDELTKFVNAPEDSQRSEPPPASLKQEPNMADTAATAPPAQTPAAGSGQDNKQEDRKAELAKLKDLTNEGIHEAGIKVGEERREKALMAQLDAIMAVCPDPAMVLDAFRKRQTAASVEMAWNARQTAEASAAEAYAKLELENKRLQAQIATGGYPGGLPISLSNEESDDDGPMDADSAKAHAEREWTNKPAVRKGFSKKENYVAFRVRELTGTLRTGGPRRRETAAAE